MRDVLRRKVADTLASAPPTLTRRDVRLPEIPGKALAVVGVRRSGKTTFLWQCLADRLAAGRPRETQLFVGFDDDRLAAMQAADLARRVEEYYRRGERSRAEPGRSESGRDGGGGRQV